MGKRQSRHNLMKCLGSLANKYHIPHDSRWLCTIRAFINENAAEERGTIDKQTNNTPKVETVKPELCKGMPHGSCKGETMCYPNRVCFERA